MTLPEIGDRIRLLHMPNDPDPIEVGATGTVTTVFDHPELGQIGVDWDNGRTLSLCTKIDRWEVIP